MLFFFCQFQSKYENSNSSLSSNPKCKLTVTQGKPLDRKEFRNSFTSPNNPNDCSMCKNADSSSKRQSAHMAQHFIPEDDVDISQIPPSEYCHAQHKSLSTNQCDPCYCLGQNSNATSSKNRKHALSDSLNHGEPTEGNIKCHLCAKTTTKDGTQSQPQYTPQHQCQCRPPSSSCHQSRTSSPTRRSYLCYPQHCLCHKTSDASLSALTSDCCSPKQNKSSACSIHSFARNSVRSGSGCRSPLCHHESSGQKFRSHSLPRTGCSGINLCNHSTEVDRSTLSIADITKVFLWTVIISSMNFDFFYTFSSNVCVCVCVCRMGVKGGFFFVHSDRLLALYLLCMKTQCYKSKFMAVRGMC